MTDEEQNKNYYEDVLENDAAAIEAYINNIYKKSVPPPVSPSGKEMSFWRIAGLESSIFVLSAIGAAVLSAIRTGGLFYILEVKLIQKFAIASWFGQTFGLISMAASLLAFEGFILAYGLTKGKESGRITISKFGLIISLLTIVAAGIFSSFSIVSVSQTMSNGISIVLALITGGAAAGVAFFSSENFGFILNHVIDVRNTKRETHEKNFFKWRSKAVASYAESIYNIRHKRSKNVYAIRPEATAQAIAEQPAKVSEKESNDWRKVRQKLSPEELKEIANLTPDKMKELSDKRGITYKTVSNWRANARRELDLEQPTPSPITPTEIPDLIPKVSPSSKATDDVLDEFMKAQEEDDILNKFIKLNKRFPNGDELRGMKMTPYTVSKFMVENKKYLLESKILDQEAISAAEDIYKKD